MGVYGIFVLLTIAALLLAREAFYAATAHSLAQVGPSSVTDLISSADEAL